MYQAIKNIAAFAAMTLAASAPPATGPGQNVFSFFYDAGVQFAFADGSFRVCSPSGKFAVKEKGQDIFVAYETTDQILGSRTILGDGNPFVKEIFVYSKHTLTGEMVDADGRRRPANAGELNDFPREIDNTQSDCELKMKNNKRPPATPVTIPVAVYGR